jgi:hypothetical protein
MSTHDECRPVRKDEEEAPAVDAAAFSLSDSAVSLVNDESL